jgi:hypothetical protein
MASPPHTFPGNASRDLSRRMEEVIRAFQPSVERPSNPRTDTNNSSTPNPYDSRESSLEENTSERNATCGGGPGEELDTSFVTCSTVLSAQVQDSSSSQAPLERRDPANPVARSSPPLLVQESTAAHNGSNSTDEESVDVPEAAQAPDLNHSHLEPELILLGSLAEEFCVSQGIMTVENFLSAERDGDRMMHALIAWRKREKGSEWKVQTATRHTRNWRIELLQRRATRLEQPVGLHPAFEVFSPSVRSFLVEQSIANPRDLRQRCNSSLSRALVVWREKINLPLQLMSARNLVYYWNDAVARHSKAVVETVVPQIPQQSANTVPVNTDGAVPKTTPSQESSIAKNISAYEQHDTATIGVDNSISQATGDSHSSDSVRASEQVASKGVDASDSDKSDPVTGVIIVASDGSYSETSINLPEQGKVGGSDSHVFGETQASTQAQVSASASASGHVVIESEQGTVGQCTDSSSSSSQLDPELILLGSPVVEFCVAQATMTLDNFLSAELDVVVNALIEWRKREKMPTWKVSTAANHIRIWRNELLQRRATRLEQPVGLHPAFEVFSSSVRSFLVEQSIANPSDLLQRSGGTLSRAFANTSKPVKLATATRLVKYWKKAAARQPKAVVEMVVPQTRFHEDASDTTVPQQSANAASANSAAAATPSQESPTSNRHHEQKQLDASTSKTRVYKQKEYVAGQSSAIIGMAVHAPLIPLQEDSAKTTALSTANVHSCLDELVDTASDAMPLHGDDAGMMAPQQTANAVLAVVTTVLHETGEDVSPREPNLRRTGGKLRRKVATRTFPQAPTATAISAIPDPAIADSGTQVAPENGGPMLEDLQGHSGSASTLGGGADDAGLITGALTDESNDHETGQERKRPRDESTLDVIEPNSKQQRAEHVGEETGTEHGNEVAWDQFRVGVSAWF